MPLTRIFLGIAALVRGPEAGRVLWGVLRPDVAHFPLIGLPLPPQNAVPLIVAAWMMLALAFTLGKWPKITGSLLVGLMAYTLLLDEQTYSNHLYLLILLVGIVSLAPSPEPLLRCQLTIVYTFAGLRKLTPVYLSGAVIAAHLPLSLHGLRHFEIMFPLAIASIFTEAFLAIAFWSTRFRLAAWVVGIGLHGSCTLLLAPGYKLQLTVFSLEMIALYTAFGFPHALRGKRPALSAVSGTSGPRVGWILYDGGCGVCSRWVPSWAPTLTQYGLAVAPLQSAWVEERTGMGLSELLKDIRLVQHDGTMYSGPDVYRYLMRQTWWAYPLYLLSQAPILRQIFDWTYSAVAVHRMRISESCGLKQQEGRSQ